MFDRFDIYTQKVGYTRARENGVLANRPEIPPTLKKGNDMARRRMSQDAYQRQIDAKRELRRERRSKGLCADCGEPSGTYRCVKCAPPQGSVKCPTCKTVIPLRRRDVQRNYKRVVTLHLSDDLLDALQAEADDLEISRAEVARRTLSGAFGVPGAPPPKNTTGET